MNKPPTFDSKPAIHNPMALQRYLDAGMDLIPLRGISKQPLQDRWTTRDYSLFDAAAHMAQRQNVGVRLSETDLVIDYDPDDDKTGNSLDRLLKQIGISDVDCSTVITGGNGMHLFFRKPAGIRIRKNLDDFPGIDFLGKGCFVVSAGSVHPETGQLYKWDSFAFLPFPSAPDELLRLIGRTRFKPGYEFGSAWLADAGIITSEQLAALLEGLDPEDYKDHDKWRDLMMACHHATKGEGSNEFIAWSISDPEYRHHEQKIQNRWDSLKCERPEGIKSWRHLYNELCSAGRDKLASVLTTACARRDFDDDLTEEELVLIQQDKATSAEAAVARLNQKFCVVNEAGNVRIWMRDEDHTLEPARPVWSQLTKEAFSLLLANERCELGKESKPVSQIWLTHPKRKEFEGVVLKPAGASAGLLNLWEGWGVVPRHANWSIMRELIEDVICAGNEQASDYLIRWIAFMLQRPAETAEVAVALRGGQGTGKSTLGRALMHIAGPHGLTVASPDQLAGRFNSHLRNVVFLFADEALWGGRKEHEGTLKQLVTEPVIAFEKKGQDIVRGRNLVHLLMASNEEWVAPTGIDDRRFLVLEVSNKRQQDIKFFRELNEQLYLGGGLEGMLEELLSLELGDWHPRDGKPKTAAHAEQKLHSLKPLQKWWLSVLEEGDLPGSFRGKANEWQKDPVVIGPARKKDFVQHLQSYLQAHNQYSAGITSKSIARMLQDFGGLNHNRGNGKNRTWVIPPVAKTREIFETKLGFKPGELFDS